MAELRGAIVGYGPSGRFFHAPLIAATEGLAVAAVVTSSEERGPSPGPPPVDPYDAVAARRVLDAARAAALEQRVVEL